MVNDFIERVYLSVSGELVSPVPGVDNAFAEGEECSKLYEAAYQATIRLRERLGIGDNDDSDLDIIADSIQAIQRELCRKMFIYGVVFGRGQTPK